jgi:hypothetical protein
MGPDLSNVGSGEWRNEPKDDPAEARQARRQVAPASSLRATDDSCGSQTCRRFRYLFETRKISGQRSVDALDLTGHDAPEEGYEIVPSADAKALVAYLFRSTAACLCPRPNPLLKQLPRPRRPMHQVSTPNRQNMQEGPDRVDYQETADVTEVHASIKREHSDPKADVTPIPIWLTALCGVVVCWAGAYLGVFHGGFSSTVYNEYDSSPSALFRCPRNQERARVVQALPRNSL